MWIKLALSCFSDMTGSEKIPREQSEESEPQYIEKTWWLQHSDPIKHNQCSDAFTEI